MEQKLPPHVLFFRKKNNWSFTTAIFCKNWEEAFLITFSENGTLLITYGFCGGVPTQNGGWNNCSYEKLWNPYRTGEESFRSNGVKIRNLQKKTSKPHRWVNSPTDDPFHISKSMRYNLKTHRDQQIILMTSQILKFWSVDLVSVYHVYTVCMFIDFYYRFYQQNLLRSAICCASCHLSFISSLHYAISLSVTGPELHLQSNFSGRSARLQSCLMWSSVTVMMWTSHHL